MKISFPRFIFYIGMSLVAIGIILMIFQYNDNYAKIFLLGIFLSLAAFVLYIIREFKKSDKDYKLGMMEK